MIIVDTALEAREKEGRPIRVALLGAGFMSHGLANHIVNTTPGMRLVGVYNRSPQRAFDLYQNYPRRKRRRFAQDAEEVSFRHARRNSGRDR